MHGYEAHVTIEFVPGDEERMSRLIGVASVWCFRIAKLYMSKDEPSRLDTFLTANGSDYENMKRRVIGIVNDTLACGIKVLRYKIEHIVVDSKSDDAFGLLG